MTEKLKNTTSELIEKYINILEQNGDPNEGYKTKKNSYMCQ